MKDTTNYILSDVPPEPEQVVLDEEGTTLELNSDILDMDKKTSSSRMYPASKEMQKAIEPGQKEIKLSSNKFMEVLKKMLGTEQITHEQMLEMRRRFGITNASFHAKKVDPAKKKRARKLARAKRRINRHNGSMKGQSRNGGKC